MSAYEGRRRTLSARYTLAGNGLERLVVPGTDPSRRPPRVPLPSLALPANLAGRVLLLQFASHVGVAALTTAQIEVAGAAVRWVAAVPAVAAVVDGALEAGDRAWLAAFAAAVDAAPGQPGRWLIVHTEGGVPTTAAVALRAAAAATAPPPGFDARLAALQVVTDPVVSVEARAAWLNGIHHVLVADRRPRLSERLRQRVVFVNLVSAFGVTDLRQPDVTITGGVTIPTVAVRWVWPLADIDAVVDATLTADERTQLRGFAVEQGAAVDAWLAVCTEALGDYSRYTLQITGDPRFDALLSAVAVNLKIDCPSPLDCKAEPACTGEPPAPPVLDYLTRDFNGFRRLLLDRLAVLGAADSEQNPAGMWAVLVELIAARADQLAYAQDAVATEAYLHTARLRPSVRRHARLLDYRVHEGVNARAFVHLVAAIGVDRVDPVAAGDLFLTRLVNVPALMPPALPPVLPADAQVFRAVLPLRRLTHAHNAIGFHAWGEAELCLRRGATRCSLRDPGRALRLTRGDVLLLEAIAGRDTDDADPALRHAVRLAATPREVVDPLLGDELLEVEWLDEDALPFDLPVLADARVLAVARGNLVLVDHGRPVDEPVALTSWGSRGRLQARLSATDLTFVTAAPDTALPTDGDDRAVREWQATTWSASEVVRQDPRAALATVTLQETGGPSWSPQVDLLASDPSRPELWVEMDSAGRAQLQFGDGTTGRKPSADAELAARYRTGNGTGGNVGAEAIGHLLSIRMPAAALSMVRNPMPAVGGVDPEPLDVVRASAPYAFRTQERAVTMDDWAEVARRHREVQRAVARMYWTGSYHTVRVHIDRVEGRPVDDRFIRELTAYLERFRLAGYDLEVLGPAFVPLDIVLSICVSPGAWPEAVAGALQDRFGTGVLPDGNRAFFHPDNFTFGDSVYLSQIVAAAMATPGVRWVDVRPPPQNPTNRFRRWASTGPDQLAAGVLRAGALEIIRCDSNPSLPERGRIRFDVEGGA